jgi:hypothetical protein
MIHMTYINAEMELVNFAAEDILATSTGDEVVETTDSVGAAMACGSGEDLELEEDSFD